MNNGMSKKKINTVTFDLWQTLIADSFSIDRKRTRYRVLQIRRILAEEGIQISRVELSQAHQDIWECCQSKWKNARDISFGDQVKLFLDLARPGLSKELKPGILAKVEETYARAALLYPPRMMNGVNLVLRQLRKDKYRIGLICNTGRTPGYILRKLLRKYRLLRYFDVALFSDEILVRKPDPKIFRLALKILNCRPVSALHVGDDLKNDVQGALKTGMQAIWIEQPAQKAPAGIKRIKSVAGLSRHLK
jgi:putative hydrolase of the HAD superfamily